MSRFGPQIGDAATQPDEYTVVSARRDIATWSYIPLAFDLWNSDQFLAETPQRENGRNCLRVLSAKFSDWQGIGIELDDLTYRRVPHPHVAFLVPTLPASGYEADLTNRMKSGWGTSYIDPYLGCRARFFSRDGVRQAIALWGKGIFVPDYGEVPVGDVCIAKWNPAQDGWGDLKPLHIGETAIPAGLYRGQSGIAFSGSPFVTLAHDARLHDGKGSALYFLSSADLLKSMSKEAFRLVISHPPTWPEPKSYPLPPRLVNIEGYDAAFEFGDESVSTFRIACRIDNRKSRLFKSKPFRGYQIIGLIAPPGGPYRWWVNFDHDDQLVSSAMTATASTAVVRGNAVEKFDCQTGRWKPEDRARVVQCKIDGRHCQALHFLRKPVGYLSAVAGWRDVAFEWSGDRDGFSLDWLDFTGAAEMSLWGGRKGLAELQQTEETGNDRPRELAMFAGAEDGAPPLVLGPLVLKAV